MKGFFFFKSVGVPGGSPELRKGNSGWVPSLSVTVKQSSSNPHAPSLTGSRSKCHPRRPQQNDPNRVGIPYA